jgi:cyanophycin synthetase
MQIRKVQALRGPNIWANFPVLEAWVDLGSLKDFPSDELPGFNERLMAWLPTMIEHRCSVGERGGFFERLRRGTYQAHILEHVTLELQTLAGCDVGFGRARETSEAGVYKVVVEFDDEDLGRACLDAALELCLAAVNDTPYDVPAAIQRLRELAGRVRPAPATAAILRAARKRDVPVRQLPGGGLIQLGHGARQQRILGSQTGRTSALAESIARDHELTRTLLRDVGVPVPDGQPAADTPAWRLLVVGEQVVAATRSVHTTGAGNGQAHTDVTDRLHPEVVARALEAARVVGLDVAGIDIVADDLSRPLEDQGGVVVAVDAHPDLGLHVPPVAGPRRPVGEAIIAHLFPDGQTGRIPIVGVTGVNGKTTTTRCIAHIVGRTHRCVGMTCTEGIYVGGRRTESGDCSGPQSARAVLQNPKVDVAVLETARGGILREGLGFDRCDVAVVTNIGEGDHLGVADIDTLEQLARVKRTLVEAVPAGGAAVLKADDPLVAAMASECRGHVVLFARDGNHPALVRHRKDKGRAVFVRDRHIVLADGAQEIPLVLLDRVPLTHGGRIGFQVENALAATAATWSLGVPCEVIRVALETFTPDLDKVPGRFNLFDIHGATVIVDYGHNVSSLACLLEAIGQFPHKRRLAVYSAAGDRRDCDLVRQGAMLGEAFDRVILFEDHYLRGRKQGEIMGLFRQGLATGKRVTDVQEIAGSVKAVETALAMARPDDLLVIQADTIDETVAFLRRYLASGKAGREISLSEALIIARPKMAAPLRVPTGAAAGEEAYSVQG